MSARHVKELVPAGMEDVVSDSSNLVAINREMAKNLEGLEEDVKEAKTLVRQTQSKVEELASALGKIELQKEHPEK